MTISYYLKRPNIKNDTTIFARISYNGLELKYYTPEKINPKFWSKETKLAKQSKEFREYPEFNRRLESIESDIKTVYRRYLNDNQNSIPTPSDLKILLDKEIKAIFPEKERIITFFDFFRDLILQTKNGGRFIPKTGKPYSKSMIEMYEVTLKKLIKFEIKTGCKVDFESINLDLYIKLIEYLTKELNLAVNTIGKVIRILKTVLNEATERGINKNLQFKSRKFSVPSEESDTIFLNDDELVQMLSLDLSNKERLEKVRDLFIVACFTGLRFGDFSTLNMDKISNGFIRIKQIKTENKVVIPIHIKVDEIIIKYKGNIPESISNQKTNEYLKEIGELLPLLNIIVTKTITKGGKRITTMHRKWELLVSHTARRSFATNEFLAGTPTLTIMAITGHKTEKAFYKYIKITPDGHARKLKEAWDLRG
jgi:hypothetical protein